MKEKAVNVVNVTGWIAVVLAVLSGESNPDRTLLIGIIGLGIVGLTDRIKDVWAIREERRTYR